MEQWFVYKFKFISFMIFTEKKYEKLAYEMKTLLPFTKKKNEKCIKQIEIVTQAKNALWSWKFTHKFIEKCEPFRIYELNL